MAKKKATDDVTAEWLADRGGKYQELGGAYSFFGPEPRRGCGPLLWIDVHAPEGNVSIALVGEEKQMHYFVGQRTRSEVEALLKLLNVRA